MYLFLTHLLIHHYVTIFAFCMCQQIENCQTIVPTYKWSFTGPNDSLIQVIMTHRLLLKMYEFYCPTLYWAINTLLLLKNLYPKVFLLHKLHTFLLNNVRNGIFSNSDFLKLAQSWDSTIEISVFFRICAQTVFVNFSNSHVFFTFFSCLGELMI